MPARLIPDKKIGDLKLYPYPYLDLQIAFNPQSASDDLSTIMEALVNDKDTSVEFLQQIIDRGREAGLHSFLKIANIEAVLSEAHRLTTALLTMEKERGIYYTPKPVSGYDTIEQFRLFGL